MHTHSEGGGGGACELEGHLASGLLEVEVPLGLHKAEEDDLHSKQDA